MRPIPGTSPGGVWLRYEGTYDRIQKARREDDSGLDQGVWVRDLKKADWEAVEALCLDSIEHASKDLQIAAWLMEAWIHLYGLSGARQGLEMIIGLCERFWSDLYPPIEGMDVDARIGPFVWINEKLTLQVKQIPITCPAAGDMPAYTWSDWEQALRLENLAKRDPEILDLAKAEGQITREEFVESVSHTNTDYLNRVVEECAAIEHSCLRLDEWLDAQCGKAAPGLSQLKDGMRAIHVLAENFLRERYGASQGSAAVLEEDRAEPEGAEQAEPEIIEGPQGTFRTREHAYQCLTEVAEYLHNLEPHSPTPYLIKRAVRWGTMTLAEVMQDMADSEIGVHGMYALLGFHTQGPSVPGAYDDE